MLRQEKRQICFSVQSPAYSLQGSPAQPRSRSRKPPDSASRLRDDAVRAAWLRSGARLAISHNTCLPFFSGLFFEASVGGLFPLMHTDGKLSRGEKKFTKEG